MRKKQKLFQQILMKRKQPVKLEISIFALLIAVSIYCYMVKFWAKQKHLLKFHVVRYRYKKCTYYFFNDIPNIKNFDLNNIKIDETLYKNNLIYWYIGYVMIKDLKCVKINCVNPLSYFSKENKYFEEINKVSV